MKFINYMTSNLNGMKTLATAKGIYEGGKQNKSKLGVIMKIETTWC